MGYMVLWKRCDFQTIILCILLVAKEVGMKQRKVVYVRHITDLGTTYIMAEVLDASQSQHAPAAALMLIDPKGQRYKRFKGS